MDSYEQILSRMKEEYRLQSGFAPKEESDIMLRLKVLAGEIYNSMIATDFVKRQMFVSTASGEYLDKHALERGITRKEAQKATGEVKFTLQALSSTDVVIESGTIVSTKGENARRFVTTNTVVIGAGSMSTKATVEACEGGADYNILQNTATVLVTPVLYVNSVTNEMAFKGGLDRETDEELRMRVLSSYRDISNGTNEIYYKRLAQSVSGVYSASVVKSARGAGTIDVHVCGKEKAPLSSEIMSQVQSLLDENREINVDILVIYATPNKVSYVLDLEVEDGYSFESVSAVVEKKLREYIDTLGVGESALLCDMRDIVYHIIGVRNFEFDRQLCFDVHPKKSEYCVADTIDIRQVS